MKKLLYILAIITATAQAQEVKFAVYNTISSGLIGGIGSGINKHKGQTFFNAFKKGFIKGCIGGSLQYTAKYSLKQTDYIWPSRILNSLGSSAVYNSMRNDKMFSQINIQFYLGYIIFKNKKLNYQIDAITTLSSIYMSLNYKFDFQNTLKSGSVIFINNKNSALGKCFGNTIIYKETKETIISEIKAVKLANGIIMPDIILKQKDISNLIISHEIVHSFQYLNFNLFNLSPIKKINLNLNFVTLYLISGNYHSNYFEKEAINYGKY